MRLCAQAPADGGWMRGEREGGGADADAVCVCVCVAADRPLPAVEATAPCIVS